MRARGGGGRLGPSLLRLAPQAESDGDSDEEEHAGACEIITTISPAPSVLPLSYSNPGPSLAPPQLVHAWHGGRLDKDDSSPLSDSVVQEYEEPN